MTKLNTFPLAVTLLSQSASLAQTPRIALIDSFVEAKQKYQHFNGNVLIAEKGRVIYEKSVGFADMKTRRPLSGKSVFNIASISKQFTAAAVMLCAERGLLRLDDRLRNTSPKSRTKA